MPISRPKPNAIELLNYKDNGYIECIPLSDARLVNGNGNPLAVDLVTRAIIAVQYEHHEIHSGDHYYLDRHVDSVTINDVFDIQITTPNTAKRLHMTFKIEPQNETQWFFYEGVTIITPGTTVIPVNNDRESSNVSGVLFQTIPNNGIDDANADTDVSTATLLSSGIIGSRRTAGQAERTAEVILARNTKYCMRFIANITGYIDYTYRWYEHEAKTE